MEFKEDSRGWLFHLAQAILRLAMTTLPVEAANPRSQKRANDMRKAASIGCSVEERNVL